jgi:hypothetical protein
VREAQLHGPAHVERAGRHGQFSGRRRVPDLNPDVRADRAAEDQLHSAQVHRLAHVKQQAGAGLEVAEFG